MKVEECAERMKATLKLQLTLGGEVDTLGVIAVDGWRLVTRKFAVALEPLADYHGNPPPSGIPAFDSVDVFPVPAPPNMLALYPGRAERLYRKHVVWARRRGEKPRPRDEQNAFIQTTLLRRPGPPPEHPRGMLTDADRLNLAMNRSKDDFLHTVRSVKFRAEFTMGCKEEGFFLGNAHRTAPSPAEIAVTGDLRTKAKSPEWQRKGGQATSKFYRLEKEAAELKKVMRQARDNYKRDHETDRGANKRAFVMGRAWWKKTYKGTKIESHLDTVSDSCLWRVMKKDWRAGRKVTI